jgi:hypothetical protein
MSKERHIFQPECTLAKPGIELVVTKSLQYNPKMLLMISFSFGVDQNVVNEYHNKLIQLWHEHRVHQVHEMCGSISESKRYNQILIQPIPGGECGFRDIFQTDLDLMITRSEFYLGENLLTS